ncbi:MAG: thioesterase [Sterolibacterium sp.]|nr:thioesterase [Sterolibacterium sp.]
MKSEAARWLICPAEGAVARRVRLYCFPYSGGNAAAFVPWQREIDPAIELCAVQLPGRGSRFREPPCTSFAALIQALGEMLQTRQAQSPLPFAFFGHSLGSLVAFELARHCRRQQLPMPVHLIISGCNAPPLREKSKRLHELPDAELIEKLRDYNGTPREILDNQELMRLLLPVVRADFALGADYHYAEEIPLAIPLTACSGRQDLHVQPEDLRGWQKHTHAAYQERWFEGDHFYINDERPQLLESLAEVLRPVR